MSLTKLTKSGEITPPCGTPSLSAMVWLMLLWELDSRLSVVQEALDPTEHPSGNFYC